MKNEQAWRPTKFEQHRGTWRASRDPKELGITSRLTADRAVAAYTDALRTYARGNLADLGCGHVPLYGAYRDLVTTVTCADWPSTMHPSPHLDHEVDLTAPLDMFADATFDTVLLTDVLEHLPQPEMTLREIDRIMAPGAHLILGVPSMYWLHESPYDYHRYTEHLLRLRAEELGHEVVRLNPLGGPVEVLFDITGKVLGGTGLPSAMLSGVQRAGATAGRALRGARRERADRLFPSGYVLVTQKRRGH